ncbi:hypothetical protein [Aquipuribacter sp. SD81]|uniref:hypothetical protein n=1 Tax=Aquipuribacter sp. SD81 TaxID=3127703 RepID=UPI003016CDD6
MARRAGARGPGPLWERAPTRLARQGAWGLLVLAALLLVATAGAAEVLSASAFQRQAVDRVVSAVPPGAPPRVAPVLRMTGVPGPGPELDVLLERVDALPGMRPAELLGRSFGDELQTEALVRVEGLVVGPDGETPARLVSVDDVGSRVVTVQGEARAVPDGPEPRVWLGADTAAALGVRPGGTVEVLQRTSSGSRLVAEERREAVLAGVVGTAGDGTTPADVPGSTFWAERAARLPSDPGQQRRAPVVLAEPLDAARLAGSLGDTLLWSVDSRLDDGITPERLFAAAAATSRLQQSVAARPPQVDEDLPFLAVSGLQGLAADAQDVALRTVREARPAALGAIGLGLALVLAVAVLDVARRRLELELLVGLGHRPVAVAALGVVEVLPAALLAWALSLPLAWAGVLAVTGAQPQAVLLPAAAAQAGVVVAAGVLAHGAVQGAAALAAARRGSRQERTERRGVPWRPVLVAATLAAVVGLVVAPVGDARGLDLLVPVLVGASAGALGAGLVRRLLTRRAGGRPPAAATARALGVTVLRRRLAADDGRVVVVTALAAATALAVHVLAGGALVGRAVTDKAAVLAAATSVVEASFPVELDPTMPVDGPVRGIRAPAGSTVVLRDSGTLPGDTRVDVVVVQPDEVRTAALWGAAGGPLERARAALTGLAAADREAVPDGPPRYPFDPTRPPVDEDEDPLPPPVPPGRAPVLLVGDPAGLAVGDSTSLQTSGGRVALQVVGHVPAFPGLDPDLPTGLVAATSSYSPRLPNGDVRFVSRSPLIGVDRAEVWSSLPLADLTAALVDRGVDPGLLDDERRVRSASEVLVRPAFVAAGLAEPYLVALAGLLLAAAVLALCLAVDRAATRTRAGDLVLARAGLGARGTRLLLVAEAVALLVAGVLLGVLGWALTLPLQQRLLEPEPSVPPLLDTGAVPLVLPAAVAPVGLAVLAALAAAGAVAWAGSRARGQEEVLRGLR